MIICVSLCCFIDEVHDPTRSERIFVILNCYIVKLGFTGAYIIFLFLLKNIACGYSLEQQAVLTSTHNLCFWAEIWKVLEFFIWKFSFLVIKFAVYLNRHVFVMALASADHSKAVPLLQCFLCMLVIASVQLYLVITPQLFFFCCLRKAVRNDCDLSLVNFIDIIMKTCLYNFDPLKPHFYIVKLGFTGVFIIFSYSCSQT